MSMGSTIAQVQSQSPANEEIGDMFYLLWDLAGSQLAMAGLCQGWK